MRAVIVVIAVGVPLLASSALLAQSEAPATASPQVSATGTTASDATPVQDTIQTAKLKVEGLWCPSCGYIVSQVLKRTPGVLDVEVSMRTKTAIVRYDSTKATLGDLVSAPTNYGFPSQVIDE